MHEELHITKESSNLLLSISKWTKFLSIFGFVILGIMVFFVLFTSIFISSINHYTEAATMYPYFPKTFSWGFAIMYLIIILIYFIPVFLLYKFSTNTKKAIETSNKRFLTQSLRFLNNHYKIIGTMTIVTIISFFISMISTFWGMRGMMI